MSKAKEKFPWLPVLSLAFAYGAAYNAPYVRYFLYDSMIGAMQCSNMQLSFLTTVSIITAAISSIPGGWVADKWSTKKIMIISLLGNVPFIVLSSLFVKTYAMHLVTWAVMGITTGFAFWPAVLKAIRIVGGEDNQSKSFGIFEASQGLFATVGNMIALAIFSKFLDAAFGFKVAFLSMAVYDVLAAIAVFFFYQDKKEEKKEETVVAAPVKKNTMKDTISLLKNPSLWLVAITLTGVYGLYVSQSYMTPYFTGVLGAAVTFTGVFAIMRDYGMKILGGPTGGVVADKVGSPSLLNAICLVVNAILIFIVSQTKSGGEGVVTFAMIFVLLNAFVCCMAKGTMWATMDEAHIPMEQTGTAIGIATLICIYAVDAIMPLLNGWLLDTYADNLPKAYGYYFTILIVLCLIGAVCGFLIFIRHKRFMKKQANA